MNGGIWGARDLAISRLGALVEQGTFPAVGYAVVADGEVTIGGHDSLFLTRR